ncbi:MAG TPA: lipase family protein [Acidimicrobiia bacterium]
MIWTEPFRAIPGARAWKVLYHSRAVDGRDIAVSGVVVAPTGTPPAGGRPVISWAHGTHGIADQCAPSRTARMVSLLPAIHEFITRGYVVVATDYEGLGTPGVHPYLVGDSEGRGVLDIVRAARHIRQADAGTRTIIYGHSQGGQAALFAGEIADSYAPDLHVLGVVAGAPVAEIGEMLPAGATIPDTLGFVVMGLIGAHAAYPDTNLTDVLTAHGLAQSAIVNTKCFDAVLTAFRQPVANVVAHNPADVPAFSQILAHDTAGNTQTAAPILVFQGLADNVVYKAFTDTYVKQACAIGDRVLYKTYSAIDHYHEVTASKTDALTWITNRIAGQPAPTTC